MKIRYKKPRIYHHLAFGVVWLVTAILLVIIEWSNLGFDNFLWFLIAFSYLGLYYNDAFLHYLSMHNGVLARNTFPRKRMALDEVIRVHNDWDEFTLFSRNGKMKIKLHMARRDDLEELETFLANLSANTRHSLWAETHNKAIE